MKEEGRIRKAVLTAASCVLWFIALALVLECGERIRVRVLQAAMRPYKQTRLELGKAASGAVFRATAAKAPQPPPGLKRALPARDTFRGLDEAGRRNFATQRRELVMVCDREGRILAAYASPEPPEVAALAGAARTGETMMALLQPLQAEDARRTIRGVFSTGVEALHEYAILVPGCTEPYACSIVYYPARDSAGVIQEVLACMGDSKYEEISFKYRPRIYRSSTEDPLFPQFLTSEFWTNSHGFRDEEVIVPKPPGVFRIVCIGGSTTVEGPRNDLTYPNLLERRLKEHFGAQRIEVINCGVDAMNTEFARKRIGDYLALQPDLIIDYPFANDEYGILDSAKLAGAAAGQWRQELKETLSGSALLYNHFTSWFLPGKAEIARAIKDFTLANERHILEQARQAGGDLALCGLAYPDFPNLDRKEGRYFDTRFTAVSWGIGLDIHLHTRVVDTYNELARDFCAENGALYLPVAEHLKGGTDLFADICHLHLRGIERKADIIFEHIKGYVAERLTERAKAPGDGVP